ncbi:TetR/AcrR family transcriptional regulator [Rhodococcus sp. D2-41]|uniref:TetR/AcrR family transcriptional regulator n=1 Tax=Speluncibacter jeojiensis TaxID=2710754 RepID=A0A9X4M1P2_9ACTN|nr:TetR/AcrR family transcriptional regulator [Rhodococcus sp. D2-41]MDG3012528.1 TetR/AcrR family transcriptional regulator [Rhodococcus sp. D2-41]MDG3015355.1 TetR/AcrR family transcriptional regulator [Corynebacteriales bacterium D3-21]
MAGKRTRLSPEARRAQLIELGVQMLAGRPLDSVSVEEIAEQAGISRGLLFHYFSSKHDFHVAIVRHTSEEMLAVTEPDPALPPLGMLHASLTAYIDYVTDNRGGYVSLLRGTASGDPAMREIFEQTRTAMAERVLAQAPNIGIERTPRAELAVRGWIAFVEETAISWLTDPKLTKGELLELVGQALPAVALPPEVAAALLGAMPVTGRPPAQAAV